MDPRTQRAKEKYEGQIFETTDGKEKFRVNQFNNGSDIEIEFLSCGYKRHVSSYDLGKGIKNPFPDNWLVFFTDPVKQYKGMHVITNEGDHLVIIDLKSLKEVTYQFQDQYGYIGTTTIQNIMNKQVKNPYHVNKFGGMLGEGPYNRTEYKYIYRRWYDILIRVNDPDYYREHHGYDTKAYENVLIVPEWLIYNNFAEWFVREVSKLNPAFTYEIDKDLLFPLYCGETGGVKCYGPNYVALMPHDLNVTLQRCTNINGLSRERISDITTKADYYYRSNGISKDTYNAIMNCYNQ